MLKFSGNLQKIRENHRKIEKNLETITETILLINIGYTEF